MRVPGPGELPGGRPGLGWGVGSAFFLFLLCGSWVCGLGKKRSAWSHTAAPKGVPATPTRSIHVPPKSEAGTWGLSPRPVSAVCHWGGKSGWVGISLYLKGTWKLRSPEIWYCPSLFLPLNQAEDGGPWAARQWLLRKAGHLSRSGQPSIRSGLGRAGPWVRALPRRGACMGGGCHTSRLLGGLYV